MALKVSVTAAPEGGKANMAVIDLLAAEWRVPKSTIQVVLGAAGRRKLLHLAGDPAALCRLLGDWLARQDPTVGDGQEHPIGKPSQGRKRSGGSQK